MKTFDAWWAAHPLSKVESLGAAIEGIRQTCREAWDASRELGDKDLRAEVERLRQENAKQQELIEAVRWGS